MSDMTVAYGHSFCCDYKWVRSQPKYFAIGGYWPGDSTHNNRLACIRSAADVTGSDGEYHAEDDKCDVGCPNHSRNYMPEVGGLCGGGCKDCPKHRNDIDCPGDKTKPCGYYYSVYACEGVDQSPLPKPVGLEDEGAPAGMQPKELPSSTAQMLRAGTEQTAPEAAETAPKTLAPKTLSLLDKLMLLLSGGSTQTE